MKGIKELSFLTQMWKVFNSLLTDNDTRNLCEQCRSRSDSTERAV